MTDTSAADGGLSPADERMRDQVEDALELANFAVGTGAKGNDGQPLPFDDIKTIQTTAALLKIIDVPVADGDTMSVDHWNEFEQAYYHLASVMSPVTAETLRATRNAGREYRSFLWWVYDKCVGDSPAQRFTRQLWGFAIGFALFIIFAEWYVNWLGLNKDANAVVGRRTLFQALVPWAYGGLGACAFLLRSAHYFIYARSFDTRRTPEYFNRILLGAISGGAIILFAEYLANTDDTSTGHLGAGALGFIAGYSGDLLFRLVERIVTAIFPKDGSDDSKSPAPPPPAKDKGTDKDDGGDGQNGDKPKPDDPNCQKPKAEDQNGEKPVTDAQGTDKPATDEPSDGTPKTEDTPGKKPKS